MLLHHVDSPRSPTDVIFLYRNDLGFSFVDSGIGIDDVRAHEWIDEFNFELGFTCSIARPVGHVADAMHP